MQTLRWILASLHLIALAIGFASCWLRAHALQHTKHTSQLQQVFRYDNWYGLATLLWIGTGLWRALASGVEKGSAYYTTSTLFWVKMGLFGLVFFLELRPMITLLRWRLWLRRGQQPDVSACPALARLTYAELWLLGAMVFVATAMARGMQW